MTTTGLIVALDDPDLPKAEALARKLSGRVAAFKVGPILFNAYGPEAILEVGQHGRVFCDLKLHDIPNTVGAAAAELTRQGVWMFTVHASGGAPMIQVAAAAAQNHSPSPLVAAVTVLTSLSEDDLKVVGQQGPARDQVTRLAHLAVGAGATALVCSALEAGMLRELLGRKIVLVVPGVRPVGADSGDQSRIATPADARDAGADYVVVGRPITADPDPVGAAERVLTELSS